VTAGLARLPGTIRRTRRNGRDPGCGDGGSWWATASIGQVSKFYGRARRALTLITTGVARRLTARTAFGRISPGDVPSGAAGTANKSTPNSSEYPSASKGARPQSHFQADPIPQSPGRVAISGTTRPFEPPGRETMEPTPPHRRGSRVGTSPEGKQGPRTSRSGKQEIRGGDRGKTELCINASNPPSQAPMATQRLPRFRKNSRSELAIMAFAPANSRRRSDPKNAEKSTPNHD